MSEDEDPIEYTIKTTDESVKKYIIGKEEYGIIQNHLDKFTKMIDEYEGVNIIDTGCGHGRDISYFESRGFIVTGIDRSVEMLKVAKERCEDTTLLNLDIRNIEKTIFSQFDGLWSCAVLHHIPKEYIKGILESFYNVLKRPGTLFLTFKIDSEGYKFRDDLGVCKYYEIHDKDWVMKLLKEIGFKNIEYTTEQKEYLWLNIYAQKV